MLNSWMITDADDKWDFSVTVRRDDRPGRPEESSDVYNGEVMMRESGPEAAQWARDAIEAWERDDWCFAVISVTPVLKGAGVTFDGATQALGGCDWGWLPGGEDDKGVRTDTLEYARSTWINDMIDEARGEANALLEKIKDSVR